MSFHRPNHPWSSGYAIPEYVRAEPPERGTFTTRWLPRGTIQQVIPDYLAKPVPISIVRKRSTLSDPTLSQSTLMGTSLSGSSLGDDTLGAQAFELVPLGASATPAAFGQRAARTLITRMKGLPADQRGPVMKKALAAIDRTLPARAEKHALAAQKRGMPAAAALEVGIARAMSEGATSQLRRLGGGRSSPQSRSLRGLGRSPWALGADRGAPGSAALQTFADSMFVPPTVGQCSADGLFVWALGADGTGYWRRRAAGEDCASAYAGPGPMTTIHDPGSAPAPSSGVPAAPVPMIEVGPFRFPVDATISSAGNWHTKLPADFQAALRQALSIPSSSPVSSQLLSAFADGLPAYVNNSFVQTSAAGKNLVPTSGWNPVIKAKHPVSGKDYGVFFSLWFPSSSLSMTDPANKPALRITWAEIPPEHRSWYEKIWDKIVAIVVAIVDVVGDVVNEVKEIACEVLGQQGATQAAAASGQFAVAAGTVVAGAACPKPETPLPEAPNGSGLLVPLVVAGAGGLLLLFLARRR